jgi:hypothetical protein
MKDAGTLAGCLASSNRDAQQPPRSFLTSSPSSLGKARETAGEEAASRRGGELNYWRMRVGYGEEAGELHCQLEKRQQLPDTRERDVAAAGMVASATILAEMALSNEVGPYGRGWARNSSVCVSLAGTGSCQAGTCLGYARRCGCGTEL